MNRWLACICFAIPLLLVSPGWGQAAEPIKIASIFAKTGPAAAANQHHIQAVRFAVDEINKNGGLLGRPVEIIEFDNQSSPIQSKLAAKKAAKAGVSAVIGASWSDHSLAMAPVLQKAGIPMISPGSTNEKVTLGRDFVFRACFLDSFQGQALAKFAVDEMHARTAVILEDVSSAYSQGLAESFAKEFTAKGGKILACLEYMRDQEDFSGMIAKAKELNPQVLFIPGHDESGRIVKLAREKGISALMLGGDGWSYNAFMFQGGQELDKGYYISHWHSTVDTPESKRFVENYQKVHEANAFAALSYDAVSLFADAAARAGSADPKAVRDALAATSGFKGVTGTFAFDANGDPIKEAVILKISRGKTDYFATIRP